jgi:hypothetical protein
MISFLFWNLYGRQEKGREARINKLQASIGRLARARHLDVLVFAECAIDVEEMKETLNRTGFGPYCYPESRSKKISIFTRFPESSLIDKFNDSASNRITIRHLRMEGHQGILLVGLHFYDKSSMKDEGQALAVTEIATTIAETEDDVGLSWRSKHESV